jgi:hypothetical protein
MVAKRRTGMHVSIAFRVDHCSSAWSFSPSSTCSRRRSGRLP